MHAQIPGRPGSVTQQRMMNVGHLYGRVLDQRTGKPVEFATVQLFQNQFDTITKKIVKRLVGGALTEENGEFSIENLPVLGEFQLLISAIGYDSLERNVSFDIDLKRVQQGDWQRALAAVNKDLGNLRLSQRLVELGEVVVSGSEPLYRVELDKRVYNPSKDPSNAGTTADEVLRKVPSVNVDLDGNVTLRNATPQIFVDGRPTTLSLDQIPSDVIDRIEVITNPSAKYDASGGQSGIINLVLKKNRRIGYNGNLRGGVDRYGKFNLGGDINVRQKKINVFALANYHQRKSVSTTHTERDDFSSSPGLFLLQRDTGTANGQFGYFNLGTDYFVTNRSTITLSGNYTLGRFEPFTSAFLITDTLREPPVSTLTERVSDNRRRFNNVGGTIAFKHLFPREGDELTADLNYNVNRGRRTSLLESQYFDAGGLNPSPVFVQEESGSTGFSLFVGQTDYKRKINKNSKLETGLRFSQRIFDSQNDIWIRNPITGDTIPVDDFNNYQYNDRVLAAYATFGNQIRQFQYQFGLRAESYFYDGRLTDTTLEYANHYPVSLFPSAAISYELSNNSHLQLNYSRRIDRPGFFQLWPYMDYSDSLNLSRGNPGLKPQFTHTVELGWEEQMENNSSLAVTAYYKYTTNMITRYQQLELDPELQQEVIVNTFQNADASSMAGVELSAMLNFGKRFSLSINPNVYQTLIDGTNIEANLKAEQFSWNARTNFTVRLPEQITLQWSMDYQSRNLVMQGGGRWGGPGMGTGIGMSGAFGSPPATVQGYTDPVFYSDLSLRKDFLKQRNASVTLSFSDIFRSRRVKTYYDTDFFYQWSDRLRDPQMVRLNLSYRFGKFDTQLFRRKNLRMDGEMLQDLGGMQ
ncbi:MAG: outer membrane beta-barrel family protein [Chitinophagales bacterium]|nr:TonB-dependent receptor family protein [Chitinophagales bacterium]MDW8394260.1 outer membrane beta-barrel family protein [Chitinophagales bacterium]